MNGPHIRAVVRGIANDGGDASAEVCLSLEAWMNALGLDRWDRRGVCPGLLATKVPDLMTEIGKKVSISPYAVWFYHTEPIAFSAWGINLFTCFPRGWQSPVYWVSGDPEPLESYLIGKSLAVRRYWAEKPATHVVKIGSVIRSFVAGRDILVRGEKRLAA